MPATTRCHATTKCEGENHFEYWLLPNCGFFMWPEGYEPVSVLPVVVGVDEDDRQAALGKVELGLEDGGQLPPILLLGHSPVQPVLVW